MTKLQAIRGMHDILMDETPNWQFVEKNDSIYSKPVWLQRNKASYFRKNGIIRKLNRR